MTRLVARLLIISQGQASLEINQTPPAYRKNTHNYGCYYRENIDYSMLPARGFLHQVYTILYCTWSVQRSIFTFHGAYFQINPIVQERLDKRNFILSISNTLGICYLSTLIHIKRSRNELKLYPIKVLREKTQKVVMTFKGKKKSGQIGST